MVNILLPSYLTKADIQALMEACIKFYAIELLGEGHRGYLVTSWQIPHLGYKWKSSLDFFKDISQITNQDNIKKAYGVLAGWEKEAPDVLPSPVETQEVSETVPQNLNELVEALEKAKSQEEKSALIRSYQTFKSIASVTPATPVTEAVVTEGAGIKISPKALKFFEQSLKKTAGAPFKLVTFFSSPKFLSENPQAKRALASSISLPKITRRAEGLPETERRRLLKLIENLRQAEFSFFAQTKLSRRIFSVREITILMGPEVGLGQGKVMALIQGGAPPEKKPSLLSQVFGGIVQKAISKTATKAVTSALTKAGISITTETVAGAVGQAVFPIPGVGIAIGLIVNWLIDKGKDLLSWIKRNAPKVAIGLGIFLFGTGFVLQSTALMGTGGALAAGGFVSQVGGVGPALSNAAAGVSGALTGILSLTVASIATPLIVALISIPVIVALILFIINSGAYIVPPKTPGFTGIIESPYVGVEKEANPDCLKRSGCPSLPGTVTYKIKITAKKGTLTNIQFENKYQVLGDGSESALPDIPDLDIPQTISPVEPYTFNYSLPFGNELDDSIVLDTLTVTADAPEQSGATASDVASVIIGNPPASSCPILGGSISTGTYNGTSEIGHGSNSYWSGPAGTDCGYAIPAFSGCMGPTETVDPDKNNVCRNQSPLCRYYGYAADTGGSGGTPVFLPSIFGESLNWKFVRRVTIAKTAWGWGYLFKAGKYELFLGHLNKTTPPSVSPSGTVIGTLYPGLTPPHVHIELQINGQWVRPDFLCGGSGP
ncbi:hypothetical protein KAT60_01695 [Candidatus Woesebacteria bacterium]|nr:hypothetical protein [Candidatus Woesebacteria bacterium]